MKKLVLVALTAIITIGATGCVVTARPRPVVVHKPGPRVVVVR